MVIKTTARYGWVPDFAYRRTRKDGYRYSNNHPGDSQERRTDQGESKALAGSSKDTIVEEDDGEFKHRKATFVKYLLDNGDFEERCQWLLDLGYVLAEPKGNVVDDEARECNHECLRQV